MSGGAAIGKTILTYMFLLKKKNLPKNQHTNFNQTWYKSPLKGILNCSNKVPDPLQKGDKYKFAKRGGVI
jgi:hypothetical protein